MCFRVDSLLWPKLVEWSYLTGDVFPALRLLYRSRIPKIHIFCMANQIWSISVLRDFGHTDALNSLNAQDSTVVSNQVVKMRVKLANLNHCAVPFLSHAAANLCWYNINILNLEKHLKMKDWLPWRVVIFFLSVTLDRSTQLHFPDSVASTLVSTVTIVTDCSWSLSPSQLQASPLL